MVPLTSFCQSGPSPGPGPAQTLITALGFHSSGPPQQTWAGLCVCLHLASQVSPPTRCSSRSSASPSALFFGPSCVSIPVPQPRALVSPPGKRVKPGARVEPGSTHCEQVAACPALSRVTSHILALGEAELPGREVGCGEIRADEPRIWSSGVPALCISHGRGSAQPVRRRLPSEVKERKSQLYQQPLSRSSAGDPEWAIGSHSLLVSYPHRPPSKASQRDGGSRSSVVVGGTQCSLWRGCPCRAVGLLSATLRRAWCQAGPRLHLGPGA